jgi:hypothetical protein
MSDMPWLDDVHFGEVGSRLPDHRTAPEDPDPDDELIETPPGVILMLGFDPAKEPDADA